MVLEFHEFKYHGKLEFPKLKFPIIGRSLHIFRNSGRLQNISKNNGIWPLQLNAENYFNVEIYSENNKKWIFQDIELVFKIDLFENRYKNQS